MNTRGRLVALVVVGIAVVVVGGVALMLSRSFLPNELSSKMGPLGDPTAQGNNDSQMVVPADCDSLAMLWVDDNDINVVDGDERTPLSRAAELGCTEFVIFLLKEGANTDSIDRFGWTPLLWAAHTGHLSVTEALLDHGADVNFQGTRCDYSALMMACARGHVELAHMLLKRGANTELTRGEGRTSLWNAMERYEADGNDDMLDLIDTLVQLAPSEHTRVSAFVIAAGAPAGAGRGRALQRLIDTKVDVNTVVNGRTALHWAAEFGSANSTRILLHAGADPSAQDGSGQVPLDLARLRNDECGRAIVRMLREYLGGSK